MGCNLFSDSVNPLNIFSIETLYREPDHEFEPALNYLVNNDYDVIIYDKVSTNWGPNIGNKSVTWEKRAYELGDIELLSKHGWCIIPCSLDNKDKPLHAILIYKGTLRDPINEREWRKTKNVQDFKAKYFPSKESRRFLIAFRKLVK